MKIDINHKMENSDDVQFKTKLKKLNHELDERQTSLKNRKRGKTIEDNNYKNTEAFMYLKSLARDVLEVVLKKIASYSKSNLSLSWDNKRSKKNLIIWANEHWDKISPIIPKIKLQDDEGNIYYLSGDLV